jgi:hypothetical protein
MATGPGILTSVGSPTGLFFEAFKPTFIEQGRFVEGLPLLRPGLTYKEISPENFDVFEGEKPYDPSALPGEIVGVFEKNFPYITAINRDPPKDSWWEETFPAIFIMLTTAVGGLALAGAGVAGAGGAVAGGTESLFVGSDLAAYDAALAAGASEGVGVAATGSTIATGAEVATGGGIFSSIGSGLKTTSEALGVSSLLKSAITSGGKSISNIIDREVSSMFGGASGTPGQPGQTGTSGGGMSFLPFILIGITLLGAFILTRKKRR